GGAGHGRNDGALFTSHAIEKRGLADVRASNNGNFNGCRFVCGRGRGRIRRWLSRRRLVEMVRSRLRRPRGFGPKLREGRVEKIVHTGTVLGGNGKDRNAER